jgi:hypothetical protein
VTDGGVDKAGGEYFYRPHMFFGLDFRNYCGQVGRFIGRSRNSWRPPDSYKIRRPAKNRIVSVAASAFLEFYTIPHEKTRSYPAVWNEQETMIVLDLT